ARHCRADSAAAGNGSNFHQKFFWPRQFPPAACQGARFGTHAGPVEFRQRQRARSGRAAHGVGTNSGVEANPRLGGARGPAPRGAESLVDDVPTAREDARPTSLISDLDLQISESPDLVELISRAIVDEPPLPIKEGGMIRDGFDSALVELRTAQRGGKDWIAKLQADEIASTGIASLKVRFNS